MGLQTLKSDLLGDEVFVTGLISTEFLWPSADHSGTTEVIVLITIAIEFVKKN